MREEFLNMFILSLFFLNIIFNDKQGDFHLMLELKYLFYCVLHLQDLIQHLQLFLGFDDMVEI